MATLHIHDIVRIMQLLECIERMGHALQSLEALQPASISQEHNNMGTYVHVW